MYYTNILNSDARILNSRASFLMICVKILKFYVYFLLIGEKILNSDSSFLNDGGRFLFSVRSLFLNEKSCLDFCDSS